MGTKQTKIEVLFDTGSDWTMIPDSRCKDCSVTHDASVSGLQTSFETQSLQQGLVSVEGMTFADKTCLAQTTCAEGFEYFGYTSAEGIEAPIQGIVGLSQNKQKLLSEEEIAVGPLLIDALLADGAIDSPKFSFAMNGLQTDE